METPTLFSKVKEMNTQNPNPSPSPSSSSSFPASSRLWRPQAQKNLKNKWSKISTSMNEWIEAASNGKSHATSVVNNHLGQRYMAGRDLGVLKDMPDIRKKACEKLAKRQGLSRCNLLSSYEKMVRAACDLVDASKSLRCYVRGSAANSLLQFCDYPEDTNDSGDGGGIPVFSSFTISYFEDLAQEIVEMFSLELSLKRLLVIELLSSCKENVEKSDNLNWLNAIYPGEFDDLKMSNLLPDDSCHPLLPRIKDGNFSNLSTMKPNHSVSREILEVYLTAWLASVNIELNRITEIIAMVEEEMDFKLSFMYRTF